MNNHFSPRKQKSLNDCLDNSLHYPTFAETLSNFQNLISEAKEELSKPTLKTSSLKQFECKKKIPKTDSKVLRRKSLLIKSSSTDLINFDFDYKDKSLNNSFTKISESDDEKSKKKVLNSSIIEKNVTKKNKKSSDNINEHFTNLLRVRNENTLIKLIKMHLLMLLDLDGENFSNIFEEESKKTNTIKKKKDNKSHDKNFFQQVLTDEKVFCLYTLIDFIGKDINLNQEGLFRKCGSTSRQQELKYKIQNNIAFDLNKGEYTVHDCTNVLKICLSEMSEPLLTDFFLKIISQKLSVKKEKELCFQKIFGDKNLKIIQLILLMLPMNKRKFAHDLLILLNKTASKENSSNKMDAKSLATLFAPHLLCPRTITPIDLQKYVSILTLQLEFMIENVKLLFKTPIELTLDIKKELERMDNQIVNEDDGINTVLTFCDRNAAKTDLYTEQHIAELYAHIQNMPETPSKKKLIKQFNRQNGGLTPLIDKENSKKKSNKLKSIGDKLKNAKNLFRTNNIKNVNSTLKKENINKTVLENNAVNDNLTPNKKYQKVDVPLADLTITKFCIDDEDDNEILLNHNKKLRTLGNSTDEIFYDVPYASESIIL